MVSCELMLLILVADHKPCIVDRLEWDRRRLLSGWRLNEGDQNPSNFMHGRPIRGLTLGAEKGKLENLLDTGNVHTRDRDLRINSFHYGVITGLQKYL